MYIVVDVGGTNTRVASFENDKEIKEKIRFKTPKAFDKGVDEIVKSINKLSGAKSAKGIVLGVPGSVNRVKKEVNRFANLPNWPGTDIVNILENKLKTKIYLENDAELAALGEACFGSGRKHNVVAYLTISTGIGGALVVEKKLIPSLINSEPGHMYISFQKDQDVLPDPNSDWEKYGAGPAFERRFKIKPEDCDDPTIWEKHAAIIGRGLINIIRLWSPEIIVIGGGISMKGDLFFKPLSYYVKSHFLAYIPPPVVPSELGDDAGLYGGLALLSEGTV